MRGLGRARLDDHATEEHRAHVHHDLAPDDHERERLQPADGADGDRVDQVRGDRHGEAVARRGARDRARDVGEVEDAGHGKACCLTSRRAKL